MTTYLLHGGYTSADNELNRTFFAEFVKDIKDGAKVLLVLFASEPNDVPERFAKLKNNIIKNSQGKEFEFVLAEVENFAVQLKEAEAVFFQGGNTNLILEALKDFASLAHMLEGKIVAGSSAGAYLLATYGTAHSENNMRKGMAILPIRLVCHYESPELPPSTNSLNQIRETAPELELVYLGDCEWRRFEGGCN